MNNKQGEPNITPMLYAYPIVGTLVAALACCSVSTVDRVLQTFAAIAVWTAWGWMLGLRMGVKR